MGRMNQPAEDDQPDVGQGPALPGWTYVQGTGGIAPGSTSTSAEIAAEMLEAADASGRSPAGQSA